MTVNLTNGEVRQFELAGITREMIGKTIERDRAAGIPDNEIELRAVAKAEQLEKANPSITGEIFGMTIPNEDIDRGIRSFKRGTTGFFNSIPYGDTLNRGIQAIGATYGTIADKIHGRDTPTVRQYLEAPEGVELPNRSFGEIWKQHYDEGIKRVDRTIKEMDYDHPGYVKYPLKATTTISSYGLMPTKSIPAEMVIYGADAFQQGYNKDLGDRAINAGLSAGIVGALGGAGAILNKGRNVAKPSTEVVKNEVSETLGRVLENNKHISASDNALSQIMGKAEKYSDKETLVKQLPSIVKQSKEVGAQLKQAAQKNVDTPYIDLVTNDLKERAKLLRAAGKEETATKIEKIADSLKDKKLAENIDDLFTKGVTEAEDSLASVESKKITDLIDDYLEKIGKSVNLTKAEKDIIKANIFNTGMERRAAKRIAFIDEAKMAKDVTEKEVRKLKRSQGVKNALTIIGGLIDLASGGIGLTGALATKLLTGAVGASKAQTKETLSKLVRQKSLQDALKSTISKSRNEEKAIKDLIKQPSLTKEQKVVQIQDILDNGLKEPVKSQSPSLIKALGPQVIKQTAGQTNQNIDELRKKTTEIFK